jgi:hypothetical protein
MFHGGIGIFTKSLSDLMHRLTDLNCIDKIPSNLAVQFGRFLPRRVRRY